METNAQFAEDILSLIGERPKLVSEILDSLRASRRGSWYDAPASGRRWKNVREQDVLAVAREYGAHYGWRRHGAGNASYLATVPFTEVLDQRHGNMVPVQEGW